MLFLFRGILMTKKIVAGLIGALLLGLGTAAQAASCPAAPTTQIVFEKLPSDLSQDVTLTTREVATKAGSSHSRIPAFYDADVSTSSARATSIAKLPDGTVCAALGKLTVRIGLTRKLYLAKELTENSCVLNAFAAEYGERAKADDATLDEFAKTLTTDHQAEFNAIGWQTAATQDDAVKMVGEKSSAVLNNILPKFIEMREAAQAKIDTSKLPADGCNGATQKLSLKVGYDASN
jgi:hypothetical protein